MAVRATRGKGLADALSREIEVAVSKVIAGGKLPTSKDVKKLTGALRSLNKMLKKMSAGAPGRKAAGAAVAPKRKGRKPKAVGCSVRGCKRPHYAKGMCDSHYNLDLRKRKLAAQKGAGKPGPKPKKRGRPPLKPKTKVLKTRKAAKRAMKKCSIKGCTDKHYAKGLCRKHYMAKKYAAKKKTGK